MRTETMGGLRVRITGGTDREGGGDGPAIVLLHGFGAPGDDLVSLWRVIDAPPGTRFVFPEAPHSLPGFADGRAWWMIDLAGIERALARGETRDLSREVPDGMAEAHASVVAMLGDLDRTLHPSKLVLGGFSQGAMLSCDVALRSDVPLAGLVMLSGTFVAEDEWRPRMPLRKGLPVFESHGKEDRLLPFVQAERLQGALTEAGLAVTWSPFRGGHEIPSQVVSGLGTFLRGALAATAVCASLAFTLGACAGAKAPPQTIAAIDAGAPDAAVDDEAEPTDPVEKPFAKDPKEAMSMMDAAVDTRQKKIGKCVDAYRARKEPMAKLVLKIGVDQEGTLIGVTGKDSESDPAAIDCVRTALRRAPFPRSHAGVIEIVKTFEYKAIHR